MNRRTYALLAALAAALAIRSARRRARRTVFAGRVVVITGGSRGLGLQVARDAAARGARLALLARSEVELAAARDELRASGATVLALRCNVRSDDDVRTAFARIEAELGPVDVLVNVAGIIGVGPVDALTMDDYVEAIDTNYLGAVRAVEAVRPAMQRRRAGRIVNISSIGGKVAIPLLLPYSASKFALRGYSEGLRAELARDGISVTTVVPGLMRTGSPPHGTFAGQPELEYALFAPADELPFTSISVASAARSILDATERGAAEIVLSPQAKLLSRLYAVAPRAIMGLMATVNRVLPRSGGSTEHRPGSRSTKCWSEPASGR